MRRTREDARGLAVVFGQPLVVDAIDAKRALSSRARALIELARAVRARPRAVVAADALVVVDEHDAVAALVARAGRDTRGRRRLPRNAGTTSGSGSSSCPESARPRSVWTRLKRRRRARAVGVVVGERAADRRCAVPFLARGGAGVAADADVEIDHRASFTFGAWPPFTVRSGQRSTRAAAATVGAPRRTRGDGAARCHARRLAHFVRCARARRTSRPGR